MNKIGFKNFRRFVEFPPIEYGDISFLVGKNNSGKSTLVKAFLLIVDYLKSENIKTFSFSKNNVEDVNIVTFERARSKAATDKFIEFDFTINDINVQIQVLGEDNSTVIDITYLKINDLKLGYSFILDPINSLVTIENQKDNISNFHTENQILLENLQKGEKSIKDLIKLKKVENPEELIKLNIELKSLNTKIKYIKAIIKTETISENNFCVKTECTLTKLSDIIEDSIFTLNAEYELQYHEIQKGKKPKKDFADLKVFKESKFKIEKFVKDFVKQVNDLSIIYLGATLNKQSALFSIRDKKNALAQTIHEYKQLEVLQHEPAFKFVTNWMKESEFGIGESFEIIMHAGEAYEVLIKSHNISIPLADKGMGSIQAMLLILRLATIIHNKLKNNKEYIVIIEEPELNLHPALQSKLADLFYEVYKTYKIKFIIETHSEYIVRKSQVIVAVNELQVHPNVNPFIVYYFPKESLPYSLKYEPNGRFDRNFESGFFDEATSSTMTILKLQKEK